ncbi:MAG: response regulator transcription factor [Oscillospiraceae bacterium]|nr:response regulator transcription factor [Oscillospiraceae bacterium]
MPNHKILIVEDEEAIAHVMESILSANGYTPLPARTGGQALTLATVHNPDLILLDLGLPDIDGIEVLRHIRQWGQTPVLVVSARDQEKQKVEALDLGANDYITKPFGSSELLARIRAALRQRAGALDSSAAPPEQYSSGGLTVDFDKRQVRVDGLDIHLTQIEYKIVEFLARQPGRVLTHDAIMVYVWGPYLTDDNKILRVNMANIRRKLEKNPAEPRYIQTEMGVGYRIADEDN